MDIRGTITDLHSDTRLSGAELRAEVARRAGVLAQVPRGNGRFVIAHGNSPAFFADLLAVWAVGGTALCMNQGITAGELETVAAFAEPDAILVRDAAPDVAGVPMIDAGAERDAGNGKPSDRRNETALILFTSGTTGQPKGVALSHDAIAARIRLNRQHIGDGTMARTLCMLPTHFGHGLIGNCLTPLAGGGDLALFSNPGAAGLTRLGEVIDDQGITFLSSVPGIWKLGLRLSKPPRSGSLQRVHVGSAPLSSELWGKIIDWTGAEVVNMYGLTETANWVAGASSSEHAPETGLMGRLWGGEAAVLADGAVHAQGEGEILLRVPSLFDGYLNRPDLNAEVFRDGFYRTGDIGTIDAAGLIRLTGRARYVINLDGTKIYPEELDLLLETHADIAEACAFGRADPAAGQSVAVAIKCADGAHLTAQALRDWLGPRIRAEAIPAHFHFLDDIPKTDRGKINRDTVAAACAGSGA